MKKIIFICMLAFCCTMAAQNRSVKHRTDNVLIPGWAGYNANGTFDYSYYENNYGDYVKHGSFKISGSRSSEKIVQRQKVVTTQTYLATGNYVDGMLDGILTISKRIVENQKTISDLKITAGYSKGLPHGDWKVIEDGKVTLKCHFTEGKMTGYFESTRGYLGGVSYNVLNKVVTGQFDNEGKYDGTWHVEQIFAIEDYEFVHGVLCRYILRDTDGTVKNKQDQYKIQPEKVKEIAQMIYSKQITIDSLVNRGFESRSEDLINAQRAITDIIDGNVNYGFELFGGQKSTYEKSFYPFYAPKYYLYIYPEPSVPDKYMTLIYDYWEKTLKEYAQGTLSEHDTYYINSTTSPYEFLIRMGSKSIRYFQKKWKQDNTNNAKYYLPHSETEVYIFDDPRGDTQPIEKYYISKKQAAKLNEYVDRLMKLKIVKERNEERSRLLFEKEKKLKKKSSKCYEQYETNLGLATSKDASNEGLFIDRMEYIDNYLYFAAKMDSITKIICPPIIKKAEGLPIIENINSFISSIDNSISDVTARADVLRIDDNIRSLRLYERMIALQKEYFTTKEQIDSKSKDYKHIGLSFQTYCSSISIPNEISYDSIAFLKGAVREIGNILQTINTSDLKSLDKQIKAFKKDYKAQYQVLIGSSQNNEDIDDIGELIEEFGPENYEINIDEYLFECESACNDYIRIQTGIRQGIISSDSDEADELELLWKTISSVYDELETMIHVFSEEQLNRFNSIKESVDNIISSFE